VSASFDPSRHGTSAPGEGRGVDVPRLELEQAERLFETIGEGVCLSTGQGEVVWANSVFQAIDEPTRQRILSLCRGFIATQVMDPFQRRLSQTSPESLVQRREVTSSDEKRWFEVTISLMPQASGQPARLDLPAECKCGLVTRDVTKQVHMRRDIEAIENAGNELIRMDSELVRKMNAVERLKHLESKIVDASAKLLHFDHFVIRLFDKRSGKLEPVVIYGLPESIADFDIFPLPEGNGISGYVAATGNSYICRDTSSDELFLPGLGGARSSLTIPLRLQDKILGIINVESQQPEAFDEDDRRLGEILARYIAMAFHMLDLLVVERSTVNQTVTGRLEGEIEAPLTDILREVEALDHEAAADERLREHITKIKTDVGMIRERMNDLAAGPNTLLGVGPALGPARHDPAFAGKRVLVADDHAKIRRIIGDVLRHRGCEVTLEESGVTAIATLEHVQAGDLQPFDLVISDIQMPDRNGYEVFSCSKVVTPSTPVILMTGFGYDPHHSIVRASQEGLQAVLFKPFPVERLLDEVKKALTPKA
jgi:CheY-like chemotaxis protein/putative methionine-R-sulfoxide reductase with GAF domain